MAPFHPVLNRVHPPRFPTFNHAGTPSAPALKKERHFAAVGEQGLCRSTQVLHGGCDIFKVRF